MKEQTELEADDLPELPFSKMNEDFLQHRRNNRTITNFIMVKDKFFLRKDNRIFFTDTTGKPLDYGGKELEKFNKLP